MVLQYFYDYALVSKDYYYGFRVLFSFLQVFHAFFFFCLFVCLLLLCVFCCCLLLFFGFFVIAAFVVVILYFCCYCLLLLLLFVCFVLIFACYVRRDALIDYIIVRQIDLQDVCITHAMRGAECWTDHRLIRAVLKLHIAPAQRKRPKTVRAAFGIAKLKNRLL